MEEIEQGRIEVAVLTHKISPFLSKLEDHMSLNALVRGRYQSPTANLNLTYIPDARTIKVNFLLLQATV